MSILPILPTPTFLFLSGSTEPRSSRPRSTDPTDTGDRPTYDRPSQRKGWEGELCVVCTEKMGETEAGLRKEKQRKMGFPYGGKKKKIKEKQGHGKSKKEVVGVMVQVGKTKRKREEQLRQEMEKQNRAEASKPAVNQPPSGLQGIETTSVVRAPSTSTETETTNNDKKKLAKSKSTSATKVVKTAKQTKASKQIGTRHNLRQGDRCERQRRPKRR